MLVTLFAHLDGEALNVALIMLEEERAKWEGRSQGLSDYYNSPGRLAVFRRNSRVCHRTGNPRSAGIRRHGQACLGLDDQRQIYCGSTELRVASTSRWGFFRYSHSGHYGSLPSVGESFVTGTELGCWSGSGLSGRVWRLSGTRISPSAFTGAHGVYGNGVYSLVTQLLRTAHEGRLADEKVPPEGGMGSSSGVPSVTCAERGHLVGEWARVCFSCGRQGHGVNRCSQVDTSFPFLPQGWSVDVRNGQYRAIRTGGTDI